MNEAAAENVGGGFDSLNLLRGEILQAISLILPPFFSSRCFLHVEREGKSSPGALLSSSAHPMGSVAGEEALSSSRSHP